MNRYILGIGLTLLGMGAIAPGAIADDQVPASASMSQLDLPPLTTPIEPSPTTAAPALAEVITTPPLSDVSPTHWAYTAVSNLVDAYGCLSGYPDNTFRGDQALTRYEFAAAMNACLDTFIQRVEEERQIDLGEVLERQIELGEMLGDF